MTTATKKIKKYRVLRGLHTSGSTRDGTNKIYEQGDTVESETNLVERFINKFERVYDDPDDDGLEKMTVDALKKVAEAEEVDLSDIASKKDIITAIRAAA